MSRAEEFEQLVGIETDDCIVWPGATSSAGYGHYKSKGRTIMVHVAALERKVPRPGTGRGWNAAHGTCNNRKCINYRHLSWKTPKENQADRVRDSTHSRGSNCVTAKLTEDQVREIRRLYAEGSMTQEQIGKRFGIVQVAVSDIVRRKRWAWLGED